MNKLLCFLSGGHRYKDETLRVFDIPFERRIAVQQFCCKCGEENCISIPYDMWFKENKDE